MNITLMNSTYVPINPIDQLNVSWEDFTQYLLAFNPAKTKEQVKMFNMWQFKTLEQGAIPGRKYHYKNKVKLETYDEIPNTIRRCGENAIGLWGLVLDVDSTLTLKEAIIETDGIERVIYTTFNHSLTKDKFRIVMPFTRMMTKEEFELKIDDMRTCFPKVDPASFSLSQAIYLHSGDKSLAISAYLPGCMIDPDSFRDTIKPPLVVTNISYSGPVNNDYASAVFDSLITCSNVRRGASKGDGGGFTLAQLCKSIGLTFSEFQIVCNQVAGSDSGMRTVEGQNSVWSDAVDHATATVRDNFIAKHGGKPFKMSNKKLTSNDIALQIIKKIKEKNHD
jgi:hypothetical protein